MTRVAVIGLGRIASGHDSGGRPCSHIGCVLGTSNLTLAAVADPDEAARSAFQRRWPHAASRVLSSAEELENGEAEVIVLATPTSVRLPVVMQALERRPKLLVVEKPLASTVAEAKRIVAAADSRGVALRVNFQRRFDLRHEALRQSLPGAPRCAILRYGKGLLNYGSHLIDLMLQWFGPALAVQALTPEVSGKDPVVTFSMRMQQGFDAHVIGMSGLRFDQFEIDLFFEDRRIEIANAGVEMRRYDPVPDRFYPGYTQLGPGTRVGADAAISGLYQFYQAISYHFACGAPLPGCDGLEAIAGLTVLEAALRSAREGGRRIALS
ncbi:MAG: Gfo/Idh/MocA family oxidoreductase [Pseudorhodoplanes sp.]|nr:Gfo/Idh/MocA family oxidoreductase [Pseudorhodoplanes sp.]